MHDSALRKSVAGVLRSRGVKPQQLGLTSDGLFVVDIALPGAGSQRHAVMRGIYDVTAWRVPCWFLAVHLSDAEYERQGVRVERHDLPRACGDP